MSQTKRGKLIVIEGLDNVGKTTASLKLVSKLRREGIPTVYISFPNRDTNIGQLINLYLKKKITLNDQSIHLLFSANRWELSNKILLLLESSINIICDRYVYSGIAYSLAKKKSNLTMDFCKMSDKGLPKPDMVCFLMNSIQASNNFQNVEIYEEKDFQQRVLEQFRLLHDTNWKYFEALQATTFNNLLENVRSKIIETNTSEVKFLW